MKDTITVMTPVIDANGQNHFNLSVLNNTNKQFEISPVVYANSDRYVIMHENERIPNIVIDDETLNTLIEARYRRNVMNKVISFCRENPRINNGILDDTNILTKITSKISTPVVHYDHIANACDTLPEMKKYYIN